MACIWYIFFYFLTRLSFSFTSCACFLCLFLATLMSYICLLIWKHRCSGLLFLSKYDIYLPKDFSSSLSANWCIIRTSSSSGNLIMLIFSVEINRNFRTYQALFWVRSCWERLKFTQALPDCELVGPYICVCGKIIRQCPTCGCRLN